MVRHDQAYGSYVEDKVQDEGRHIIVEGAHLLISEHYVGDDVVGHSSQVRSCEHQVDHLHAMGFCVQRVLEILVDFAYKAVYTAGEPQRYQEKE